MVLINRQGERMYPVCSWEANQHKLYNAHDVIYVWCIESNWSKESVYALEQIQRAIDAFDTGLFKDGIVYATREDMALIKKYIAEYDVRH